MNTLLSSLRQRRLSSPRSTYRVSVDLFLRALGFVYFIAFASLRVQVDGLIGSNGVLPVGNFLDVVQSRIGHEAVRALPTLCWLSSSDTSLHVQCGLGILLAAGLMLGLVPWLATPLLWLLYLSLTVAGQLFLGFQWDNLLLEAGFLAILLSPWVLRSKAATNPYPPRIAVFLIHLLLFKLMFLSGFVKLASGDVAWRDLSALSYHYWSQPLPPWTAWYVDKLPPAAHKLSTFVMFLIELAVPFLVFGPRVLRRAACIPLVFLQLLIMATGNYGFFNALTIALCIPLLDDGVYRGATGPAEERRRPGVWHGRIAWPLAVLVLGVNFMVLCGSIRIAVPWPRWMESLYRAVSPYRSVNGYGLFAVMTKSRPEIILEGSNDGTTWKAYSFRWKPGDVNRRPRFVAPHQPRLDWQFWFAALGHIEGNPWVLQVMARLLEGKREVLDLLAENPFPESPPRFIRASLYEYRFTPRAERKDTGAWWTREPKGLYCQAVSLRK